MNTNFLLRLAAVALALTLADPAVASTRLKTEKERVSYAVGLQMARALAPIEDELDIKLVMKALRTGLEGRNPLLDASTATEIRQAFVEKMQARHAAELVLTAERNLREGEAFLAANRLEPGVQRTESGLQYQVIEPGRGERPLASDIVRVHYTGSLLDGTNFDSSREGGEPIQLMLAETLPGWAEGVQLMPVGGRYRFWVPPALAYGEQGPESVGPNATVVFDVELLGVVK